jgi:hypothetical protein
MRFLVRLYSFPFLLPLPSSVLCAVVSMRLLSLSNFVSSSFPPLLLFLGSPGLTQQNLLKSFRQDANITKQFVAFVVKLIAEDRGLAALLQPIISSIKGTPSQSGTNDFHFDFFWDNFLVQLHK